MYRSVGIEGIITLDRYQELGYTILLLRMIPGNL